MQPQPSHSKKNRRKLVIRLSSLGDVILSSSVLSTVEAAQGVDWVVAKEFASVLKGHPKIKKLWEFDRSTGLSGWLRLSRSLWREGYDEVFDLHSSLRSKLIRVLFFCWGLSEVKPVPTWSVFNKERTRLLGYFWLKRFWPVSWRPAPVAFRFTLLMRGQGDERPNLVHLINAEVVSDLPEKIPGGLPLVCVMPGAQWEGKRWSVPYYVELLKDVRFFPIILGSSSDQASFELVKELVRLGVPHFSGVGKWTLVQVASVLSRSRAYLGGDTGLAHLAEAVGVPVWEIFGPTMPDIGFGPWRKESRTFGSDLWCRPCGKDGRWCFRRKKYLCLSSWSPQKMKTEMDQKCPL